ncbi:MAG: aminotransferase class V-fold PLP-dependent enzyme [Acidimicrobiia bacterium]|nr:aminotransferase class V-fold PLP-dependent enzyme [Acidimicrobiia bacterium]
MHEYSGETDALADDIVAYARWRTKLDPIPLDHPRTEDELRRLCGPTVTPDGIGGERALELFADVLAPSCLSVDYSRYLSFVPAAPTEAAVLFDLVVGAFSIYGGSWIEGAGAVYAENEALRWLADLCGLPPSAGGVFVPGGTIGNLSALVGARGAAEARLAALGRQRPARWAFLVSATAHSSVPSAAAVMDADVIAVETKPDRRLRGDAVAAAIDLHGDRVAGVVATAGSTNLGIVDDLASIGTVCRERGVFFHVDAAYGGAGLAAPSARHLFAGIDGADSVIIDPHKWLFAPFDCCALLWRDPGRGRAVHAQHAGYLSFLDAYGDWNPSDFAIHLTRRARGLPFWFSLATHGTDAYARAVEVTLDLAAQARRRIDAADHLRLVWEPGLSIVVFERIGWDAEQYQARTEKMMDDGTAFVVPSRHDGRPVFRFCFVNPRTTVDDIDLIIGALR